MKTLPRVLLAALLACAVPSSYAQLNYFEDFNSMGPTGTTPPIGWTTGYLGVQSANNRLAMTPYAGNGLSITRMPAVVNNGSGPPSPDVGSVLNLGTTGSSDRALGNYPRTTPSGDQIMQVALQNNTGNPLTAITLSYWGEQWRQSQGTSSSGQEILRVLVSTLSATDGFTYLSSLDFVAPKQLVANWPVGALDGNAAANRAFVSGVINFASPVPDGGTFYVRWHDWNDNGTADHFLGIDDVGITSVIPEPGTMSVLLLGLGALVGVRARRK